MSQYGFDDTTATGAAAIMCSGGEVNNYTLDGMLNMDIISPEYYSFVGVSNLTKSAAKELQNSSFWLGSAVDFASVWIVFSNGLYGNMGFEMIYHSCHDSYDHDFSFGARPVIVVPTNEL